MARTAITICNSALLLVGADEISSLSDTSNEGKLANALYEDVKDSLFQSYPWRFSLLQADLGAATGSTPVIETWSEIFTLPADLLRVISIEDNQPYEVYGDEIYKNGSTCKIVYQKDVGEDEMPAYFVKALNYHLAAVFAISLQEDVNKMRMFEQMAEKETQKARAIDAQQQPNSGIQDTEFSLVNVRG